VRGWKILSASPPRVRTRNGGCEMKWRWLVVALSLVVGSGAVLGEDFPGIEKYYVENSVAKRFTDKCLAKSETIEENKLCIREVAMALQEGLYKTYHKLYEKYSRTPKAVLELKKAQKHWLDYRTTDCRFRSSLHLSKYAGGVEAACYLRMNLERGAGLHELLNATSDLEQSYSIDLGEDSALADCNSLCPHSCFCPPEEEVIPKGSGEAAGVVREGIR